MFVAPLQKKMPSSSSFLLPPLIVGTAHLLTETPYSVDFAVQFAVIASVLVLVGETVGHRAAWGLSAPFMAAVVSGIVLHQMGNVSLMFKEKKIK
jgi:hypothetical protein